MAVNPAAAAAAYANSAKVTAGAAPGLPADGAKGPSFADMVKDAVGSVVDTGKKAESRAMAGVTGSAEVTDVVAAITEAELTLETVVAVRDKVIAAYQDIMKMPI